MTVIKHINLVAYKAIYEVIVFKAYFNKIEQICTAVLTLDWDIFLLSVTCEILKISLVCTVIPRRCLLLLKPLVKPPGSVLCYQWEWNWLSQLPTLSCWTFPMSLLPFPCPCGVSPFFPQEYSCLLSFACEQEKQPAQFY